MAITFLTNEDKAELEQKIEEVGQDSSQNVKLDTTLTVEGKAADAKAVGDKIAEITGISLVEPAEDDIPKVFITGAKPTTKDDVLAEMQYISNTERFHAYLEIKCQGTSSMNWPKKNYTAKLYSDETRETKLKKSFKNWNHESNKFVLKANYIDHSHARNVVSARLWGEIVASRPDYASLPVEMRNAPNNGAVDGFPIKVYYNGEYEGIYTWNIGKDDWMWGMDEDNANHVLLCAEGNTDGVYAETTSNFRKLWDGTDGSKPGWSIEVGTNSTALKTSLNNLIQFVIDNDGEDFRNGISAYLDIQSAIDYYIFQYEICGLDGLAHNMLLATYDGKLWRCGAYDLDATFGLWWNGSKFVSATYACPEDYQEQFSLLWERIEANYVEELKARQAELRASVLSYANMVTHFERFMDVIGLDLYDEDVTIYTAIPSSTTNNIKQIRNFIRDRQTYVDAEFAAMNGESGGDTEITLSSISATYNGGNVEVGTDATSLTGIVVTATYSDGTSKAVTGYTLSGTIAEGSNTITVSYGGMTTTFTVVGVAASVPCTGISLDKSTLTFTAEGTQTLTATVTPDGCTDAVVWTSDDTVVATVDGGTVTAVGNGSATITVTCGSYSASCSVSVSGIVEPETDYTLDAFDGSTWLANYTIDQSTGELKATDNEYATANQHELQTNALYTFTNASGGTYPGLALYDADNNFVFYSESTYGLKFAFSKGYTARAKVYAGTSAITPENVTFKPASNQSSATVYSKITMADFEWALNSNGLPECIITDYVPATIASARISCAMLTFGLSIVPQSPVKNGYIFSIKTISDVHYLGALGFDSLDELNTFLSKKNPTIELNIHAKE